MCQLCSQDLGQITYPQQSCSPGWRLATPCGEATWPSGPESNPDGLMKGSALNGPSFLLRRSWGWGWEREGETHKTSITPEGGCDRYKLCFPIKTMRLCVQCTGPWQWASETRPRPGGGECPWEKLSRPGKPAFERMALSSLAYPIKSCEPAVGKH